jgi:hypothetical protein
MLSMFIFAAAAASSPPRVIVLPADAANIPTLPLTCGKGIEFANRTSDKPVRAQKLNALPNANEYIAVWRGCDKPAIVRYDIGSAPVRQR